MKKRFSTELSYVVAILVMTFATALMKKADYGMSMLSAPVYVLHMGLNQFFHISYGTVQYLEQAAILICLAIAVRRFRKYYVLAFVTAFIFGVLLDFFIWVLSPIPELGYVGRLLLFLPGMVGCSLAVSFFFHTYVTPAADELFVKEVAEKYGKDVGRTKTAYDVTFLLLAVVLSFLFFGFGRFEGVKWGTILSAALNGKTISFFSRRLDARFEFYDAKPWRKFFS